MRKLWLNFNDIIMYKYSSKIFFILTAFSLFACRADIEQQRKNIFPKPFVKEIWQSDDKMDTRWSERPRMARDLIAKNTLIGKNRTEINEMLGEPDFSDSNLPNETGPNKIGYELEQILGQGVNLLATERLMIIFNSENKVEKAEIDFIKTGRWKD